MSFKKKTRLRLAAFGLSAMTIPGAYAQGVNTPDGDNNIVTADSVNPESGIVSINRTDFVLGSAADPLRIKFVRSYRNWDGTYSDNTDPFGDGWTHNYVMGAYLNNDPVSSNYRNLVIVVAGKQFQYEATQSGGTWTYVNLQPDGSRVDSVVVGGVTNAVLTTSDGYKYYFPHDDVHAVYTTSGNSSQSSTLVAMVEHIESPNGEVLKFYYENTQSPLGSIRLKALKHSRGYGVIFYYLNPVTGGSKATEKQLITKIILADNTCSTFPVGCSETAFRQLNYSYQNDPSTATHYKLISSTEISDPSGSGGAITRYGYMFYVKYHLTDVYQPNDTTTPSYHVAYTDWRLLPTHKAPSSVYIGSDRFDYSYFNQCTWNIYTTRTDPLGKATRYYYSTPGGADDGGCTPAYGGAITKIADPLGRETKLDYDFNYMVSPLYNHLLHRRTFPEGNTEFYDFDDRGNTIKVTKTGKPGSGLSDLVATVNFPACTSTNYRTCNKPSYTIDPRLNRTDYEWNDTNGQLTRVLGPADPSGVRPETAYIYTSFVGSDGNTFYLKTSETTKLTAGTSRTTAYQYDAANHFRLMGVAVTAPEGSRRTCIGYDAYDNAISQTSPRANLTTCP